MHSFFINFKRKEDFIYIFNTFYMDNAPNNILYYLYTSLSFQSYAQKSKQILHGIP